jgi:hypothetical protein
MDDLIRNILKRADEAMDKPPVVRGIAEKVRRRVRSQQRRRIVLAGIAVGAVLGGMFLMDRPRDRQVAVVKTGPPPVVAVKESDETDLKVDEQVAELLLRHEREAPKRSAVVADDYLWQLSQERNQTALILIGSGDRIAREFHDQQAAMANYRQVIRLFPDSPAAAVAQQRLRNIADKGNES